MKPQDRIIVALDVDDVEKAIDLVAELAPYVGCFKIGLEFIYTILAFIIAEQAELDAMDYIVDIKDLFDALDGNILWDGKLNDIPNTVAGASKQIDRIGVKMFNVHASAGREAVKQAVANKGKSLVLGVTVLTSIDKEECVSIFGAEPGEKVLQFAEMLLDIGADGIICSPKELQMLQDEKIPADFLRVTPGIRPKWAQKGDQKRVMTPGEAIRAGADYLVIGRPITQPPPEIGSPVQAAKLIVEEISRALKGEK